MSGDTSRIHHRPELLQTRLSVTLITREQDVTGTQLVNTNVPLKDLIPPVNEYTEADHACFLKYLGLTRLVRGSYAVTKVDPNPRRLIGKWPEYTNTTRKVILPGTATKLEIPIWPTGIIFQESEYLTLKVSDHYMILGTGTMTGENEQLLSREDEPGQHGPLHQFSRHVDQRGPDTCTETHELRQWRSTNKNTKIDESQILLESDTEYVGLILPPAQESDVNKPQREDDYEVASTYTEQNNTTDHNHNHDFNASTRLQCIVGIVTGGLLALACIASGIYILATQREKIALHVGLDTTTREVLSLVFNIILTFCIDSMAFVHSLSLRWALYSEHRLEFNTNLRLFTSSTKSGPNRWYANIFSMICLILCYGASSYLVLPSDMNEVLINGFALLTLGLALLGHAALSIWCIWTRSGSILNWSSNPLSNCLSAVQNGMLQRRHGRCMRSVHDRNPPLQLGADIDTPPICPRQRQENMYTLSRRVRRIIWLLWALVILAIGWMFTILGLDLAYAADSGLNCPPSTDSLRWEIMRLFGGMRIEIGAGVGKSPKEPYL
ncbi:hypothetical protein FCULG_00009007 [Fusarium culmorum]|uniref:Uncharacterized protein n=1 Tax=Fusarium culmorum TaxID=5516 RepID=A0A2T4GHJ2_FUSCU|nr:hypothetical protein FCULG_00009007 [Fusarium culmorum]